MAISVYPNVAEYIEKSSEYIILKWLLLLSDDIKIFQKIILNL